MEVKTFARLEGKYTDLIRLKSWVLTARQLCDVECILNGSFSPLDGFLNEDEYYSVCNNMRLTDGKLWPIPVTLDITEDFAEQLQLNEQIVLRDVENVPIALLIIQSKWIPNKKLEAWSIFGTNGTDHTGVDYLNKVANSWYIGGTLSALAIPHHYDFIEYRHTPDQLKQQFKLYQWEKIIAFQTRNPMHRAHFELTQNTTLKIGGNLLIHPAVGMTKPGDVNYITRIKCYIQILKYYKKHGVMLSLLPLAMRMAGPREALWHALIRKNYGVTHFIVGRDHAGPGCRKDGIAFYDAYAAQQLALEYKDEIGIHILPVSEMVYIKERKQFIPIEEKKPTESIELISGTALRQKLLDASPIPEWFTFSEVSSILLDAYPAKRQQGFTLLFTGFSGSGKSTLAKALLARLQEISSRTASILDGDILRRTLSNELGFSPSDRNTHLLRMAFVAAQITKHHGIAICAAIAPYESTRKIFREMVSEQGGFIEIHVATPIDICQQRDTKGLYQKAKQGLLPQMTGIDAPYEPPSSPDLIIDTAQVSIEGSMNLILAMLEQKTWL